MAASQRLVTLTLDTSDEQSIKEAASKLEQTHPEGIDYLINVAGTADEKFQPALETDGADYIRVLTVNTVGPFLMIKAFVPLLRKKQTRTVVNVSSVDGSIATNRSGQYGEQAGMQLAYSCSKAALNMQTSVLANALKAEDFTVISMCPGWVQTAMGQRAADEGSQPELSVAESTAKQLALIRRLTPADSGKFFSAAEDKELPH
ncbi:hypothetical protein WJX81_008148 [Elliptochloris bilobata]|uniref:C-factor n=1 Tax=Elliptochloris bilobata TaxID=381761 RepID=A0AAW1RYZ0_9CHLO